MKYLNWALYACEQALEQCAKLPEDARQAEMSFTIPCGSDESSSGCNNAQAVKIGASSYHSDSIMSEYAILRTVTVTNVNGILYAYSGANDFTLGDELFPSKMENLYPFSICVEAPESAANMNVTCKTYHFTENIAIQFDEAEVLAAVFQDITGHSVSYLDIACTHDAKDTKVFALIDSDDLQVTHEMLTASTLYPTLETYQLTNEIRSSGYRQISRKAAFASSLNHKVAFDEQYSYIAITQRMPTGLVTQHNSKVRHCDTENYFEELDQLAICDLAALVELPIESGIKLFEQGQLHPIASKIPLDKLQAILTLLTPEMLQSFVANPELLTQIGDKFDTQTFLDSTTTHTLRL